MYIMSDLIDRKQTIKAIYDSEWLSYLDFVNIKKVIEALPSAELERKKGKWIDEKINSYTSWTYCSECGKSAPFTCVSDDHYGYHMHGETNKTNFCPNCGARMTE